MATGPVGADAGEALRAQYDALAQSYADSEANVRRLEAQLADAQARIAALEARSAGSFSLFEGSEQSGGRLTGDGSDPRVLSIMLGATAVVAAMATLLALLNGNLMSPFGIVALVLTVVLGWAALSTKVEPIEVSVVRGLVYVKKGDSTHRFDVRSASTQVEQVGTPGDPDWELRFARRGMDPFVITASMVDAPDFVAQLRQWRPEL